jgi:UDP-glucose 4-epimerase
MRSKILVTGGLGYIGSHFISNLYDKDYEIVCIDNLSNSKLTVLDKLHETLNKKIDFYQIDITEKHLLAEIFNKHNDLSSIVHFAGLKSVNESIQLPEKYYLNNVMGTLNLLEFFKHSSAKSFIFSSSATVYGDSKMQPVEESFLLSGTNPYAWSKIMCERVIQDTMTVCENKKGFALRYFNPIGAHPQAILGEDPNDQPNNLMPHILKSANKEAALNIFGNDYPTKDGTAERDYIHVMDLASAHQFILENINLLENKFNVLNIGTGKPTSVMELINIFEKVNNTKVSHLFASRRPGDVVTSYADTSLINCLGWIPQYGIEDMCRHAWMWKKSFA